MRQIVFTLQFRGKAAPSVDESGVMKATMSATSCEMRTIIDAEGITGETRAADGALAFFESEVKLLTPNTFEEHGSITFGDGPHALRFSTVGHGHLGPSADPKQMAGFVGWKVEGGEGQFEGASGYITSNFTLSDEGDVVDHHYGVVFVP